MTVRSQNAPVTTAGIVVNMGPNVVVPVTVTNFVDICAVSITMDYDFSIAQITGISPNVSLPGFTANWTTIPGRIIMGWYGSSGVTLPDFSHLVDISFTGLNAGETALNWMDDGGSCEYAKFDGGAINVLNDSPTGDYYKNGHITHTLYGPVTIAPVITADPNQVICIPITVFQFANIGSISLTLNYNPSILTFQSISSSNIPGTWSLSGQAVIPGRLIVGGYGPGITSIPDGDVLFYACFYYHGGTSALAWYDADGSSCEYADATNLNPFPDTPQNVYYINGMVTGPPNLNGPVTIAGNVVSQGPDLTVPVIVTGFTDIGAVSLTLDYNNSIAQITGISPNVNLPGFTADWNSHPGQIIMGWYGSSGVTLPDYSHIVDISFTGLTAGETALTWSDDGGSCEYARYNGGTLIVLNDSPTGDYYKNGNITHNLNGPVTVAPVCFAAPNQIICLPVRVFQFANIGSISLTLDYDPSVLTFQGINSSAIPGTWSLSGQAVTPGRLIVGGYGPGISSIPDGDVLFNACFYYHGGTSTLNWYDADGSSCEYADATNLNPLPDIPQNVYYINGSITDSPLIANFVADNTTPPRFTTVNFTDLTIGGVTSWEWCFDRPCCVVYVGNTDHHCQHPKVQFTEGGTYTVSLTVNNCCLTDTRVGYNYTSAGVPGIWTGENSSDWNVASNWDNWRLPDNSTDVVIPSTMTGSYWPVYNGDLTIGTQCKSITIDTTSQITITGNLIVH